MLRPNIHLVIAATVATSLLLASATIHAVDPPECLDAISTWAPYYGGQLSDVTNLVPGQVLAVAQNATLLVIDISGSYSFELARLPLGSTVNDMAVCDNVLLVADDHGLTIVDVTDPGDTFEVSSLPMPNGARAVACSGRRALAAAGRDSVHLLDVRDPADPAWLDSRPLSSWDVALFGPIALARHAGGVESYDVSADTLEPVATLLGPRTLSDMQVWGGYAYVVWGNALMSWPLDVSDPQAEPQVVQVLGLSHAGWELTLGGGLAFLKGIRCALSGCTTYGVYVLELSDPVRPATIASSAPGRAVLVSGDRVIDVSQGLTVRDGAACVAATPEARLLWWPISPAAGEPVHFEDASTHLPSTWSWSFGDGGTNETQNPTHTFSEGGYYEVVLTVSNRSGTHTVAKTVWVRDVFRHLRGRVGR